MVGVTRVGVVGYTVRLHARVGHDMSEGGLGCRYYFV